MHRIRLREPWAASLNAELDTITYSRKFHKPTGLDDRSVTLQIALFPPGIQRGGALVAVHLNGCELLAEASSAENPVGQNLIFRLNKLENFNALELRVTGATTLIDPSSPISHATAPTFGSFVVQGVELEIE